MTERDAFTIAEEFAGADLNEERPGKRFRQDLETLSKDPRNSIDLFDNPVGYRTSLGKMLRILLFLSGCCSETSVSEQR
ncbi:MAG: transposase [Spirochaetaceae bacterium]|jgi:hypothetical protein|nr:transposase [Spirochaetaceae bacterium]